MILDVVYNHFGPDGNYLADFSPDYFTDRYKNDWGEAINFEGAGRRPASSSSRTPATGSTSSTSTACGSTRRRTSTTPRPSTSSPRSSATRARSGRARARSIVVAENEPQDTTLVRAVRDAAATASTRCGTTTFTTRAVVALTGRREAYYPDYIGSPQEFISAAKYGYLYQGQWYGWQKKRRGTPALDLPPQRFVTFLENHDQVANTPFGRRLHQ